MKQGEAPLNLKSRQMLSRAGESIAGSANSTMRVLPYHLPTVIERAEGPFIWDRDGNELIDMNMGYGPLIFGHRSPVVVNAIRGELNKRGTLLGFPHELSHKAAELVKDSFPSIKKLRFTSTGTEAVQTAVRLARRFTGRDAIVLFEGHYHGSNDSVFHFYHAPLEALEKKAPYSVLPGTGGMGGAPYNAYVLPWNDMETLHSFFNKNGSGISAVIMEPVLGNSGVIPPLPGFLEKAKELTEQAGALLIFDEVMTGFRIARGGAQERYGVHSDLTVLSKAMNGGVPAGAVGGRADVMDLLTHGEVFHGGVYSGNPLSMSATLAVQEEFARNHRVIFPQLEKISGMLASGLEHIFSRVGIPVAVQNVGAMLSPRFLKKDGRPPRNYREVRLFTDPQKYIHFQQALQGEGVYIHPNHFEPWFISTAHSEDIIRTVLDRVEKVAGNGMEF